MKQEKDSTPKELTPEQEALIKIAEARNIKVGKIRTQIKNTKK